MIFFEMEDQPLSQSITNDEFAALHAIVSLDWDSSYTVSQPVLGWEGRTTLVEKIDEDDRLANAVFKVDVDGGWEQVWERRPAPARRLRIIRQYANSTAYMSGGPEDIYNTREDCLKDHPTDPVLAGFGVLDEETGFRAEGSDDWYDTLQEALEFIEKTEKEGL
jgi:hypothetical protein